MNFHPVVACFTSILTASLFATPAFALDLPGGLKFGQSFLEVQATARDNVWKMQKSDVLPNAWNVKNEGLTLYFCGGSLASIDQVNDGSLVDFVETVFDLQLRFGTPDTGVSILSPRSKFEMHLVQSVFETEKDWRVSVQLSSREDRQRVFTRISSRSACKDKK